MKAAFERLEAEVAQFEAKRQQLTADITREAFMQIVHEYEKLNNQAYRIYGFANLSFTSDTQDQAVYAFLGRVEQFMATLQNRTLFFSLWWKDLDDENAERLMAESGDYRYWLEEMRHFKPHTLTEPEEKIVNIKNVTGAQRHTQPVRFDHQPLCLQSGSGWRSEGADAWRADGVRPPS